jgi:hypothetical protein
MERKLVHLQIVGVVLDEEVELQVWAGLEDRLLVLEQELGEPEELGTSRMEELVVPRRSTFEDPCAET